MLTGLLALIVLLIALLAIPVALSFKVSWRQVFQKDIELRWAFGLIRFRIPSSQSPGESRESKRGAGPSKRSRSKKWNLSRAIRQRPFRERIYRFIGDLWRTIDKDDLSLNVRVGLGDPADTGRLWAFLGPAAGMLADTGVASIRVEPEFIDETFEMDGSGEVRIIPLQILYLVVALALSPSIWRGMVRDRPAN